MNTTATTVQVREFERDDLEAAYRLDQACYPPGIAYSRYALRQFLTELGAQAWVAEEGDTLLGFVIVRRVGSDRAHVITLDVREDRRRQGIGGKLLARAEAWLGEQGARRVRLETAATNHAGVAFWQDTGYKVVGLLPRYYRDRDDAYRMEKELT